MGFEPTVTVRPHTLSKRAESAALASLQGATLGWVPGDKGIVAPHPFWSVAVGSCATGTREPGQGRKAAALSGPPGVPQIAWPPRSRAGVARPAPIVAVMDDEALMGIALDEARRNGQVSRGDFVCMVAFGAGFTWGAVTLRL